MIDGITVRILGDSGAFSRMGKSIGYQVTIGTQSYLIDCGSPLFQQIGGHVLQDIRGLIITHCHDDHKRWFTDLAIFNKYAPDILRKVSLMTSEMINSELMKAAGPALDRSLSQDSKNIIDIPYDEYIDYQMIGPRARYTIVAKDEGNGKTGLYVMDRHGNIIGPDRAKIVLSKKTGRPRMLFKDPAYNEWVEPESFYPFSSNVFYEENKNIYRDAEGFTIEAVQAPVWHGITGIGVKFSTENESLVFSSDTVHDIDLWKELYTEKKAQHLDMSAKEFKTVQVIYGDINQYTERIWSEERYRDAVNTFQDAVVIHDIVTTNGGAVHTNYGKLNKTVLKKNKSILTHGPDRMTSEWALSKTEKRFRIKGGEFFEVVGEELMPLNADIYHKEDGRFYVGYRNEKGRYAVYMKNGLLGLSSNGGNNLQGERLYNVDIYEDISGGYFPRLEEENSEYIKRRDGRVELVRTTAEGSMGKIVSDCRPGLLKRSRKSGLVRCR
jgi:ribonuclease BN (tRNA processing enzyme)